MNFKFLNWIYHGKSEKKRLSIFSIDIQPFGDLIITCGQDFSIKIWDIQPCFGVKIRNQQFLTRKKGTLKTPKQILENHGSFVNIVRWSIDGKKFASGGDDGCLIVYENSKNPTFHMLWRVYQKFRSHTGDIVDLAWCSNSVLIATASLDNCVYIWTIDKKCLLVKLLGHEGWVKGICWDPTGRFLASQSDDKKIIIWKSSSWKTIKIIKINSKKPFDNKELRSNFFSRLSWSTCGRYILVCNTSYDKKKSSVFVIDRAKNFIHRIYATGYKFVTRIIRSSFRIYKNSLTNTFGIYFSTGTTDGILSIWSISDLNSHICIKSLSKNQILDISWSSTGYNLVYCSFDGQVFLINMTCTELGKTLQINEHYNFLNHYYITFKNSSIKPILNKIIHKNFREENIEKIIKENIQILRVFKTFNYSLLQNLIYNVFDHVISYKKNNSNLYLKCSYICSYLKDYIGTYMREKLCKNLSPNFIIIEISDKFVIIKKWKKRFMLFQFKSSPIMWNKDMSLIFFLEFRKEKFFAKIIFLKNKNNKKFCLFPMLCDIFLYKTYIVYVDCIGNINILNFFRNKKIVFSKHNFTLKLFFMSYIYFQDLKLFLSLYKCSGIAKLTYRLHVYT
nr:hira [Cryptomonas sp.]